MEKKKEIKYSIFHKKFWRKLILVNFPKFRILPKSLVHTGNPTIQYYLERYTKDGLFAVLMSTKNKSVTFENIENVYKV